jgi:hypothetical protein
VRPSNATVLRFNSPVEPTGRTGRACIFYGRISGGPTILPDGQWLWKVAKPACVRLSVTTRRREKWREKDKTTVGWRAFEVMKPRSWEPNIEGLKPRSWESGPQTSRWGPETQVLRARSWNLALRSWEPNIEVLKPRSWERAWVINWLKQLTGTH